MTEQSKHSQQSQPCVTVMILNYNRKETVLKCLEAVCAMTYPLKAVYVVDNHSTDGAVEAIEQNYPKICLIKNDKNYGPARGKNIGLSEIIQTDTDYILLLDNDVIVDSELVSHFVNWAKAHPDSGILGPKIYNLENPKEFYGAGYVLDYSQNIGYGRGRAQMDEGQYNESIPMDCLLGGAMFIQREALAETGFFDEYFMGFWYEGQDLCLRFLEAGYQNYFVHEAKVWHRPHQNEYSYRKKYLAARNAIYFIRKHASLVQRMKFLSIAFPGLAYAVVRETPRGNLPGVIGKAQGLWDGIRGKSERAGRLLNYGNDPAK